MHLASNDYQFRLETWHEMDAIMEDMAWKIWLPAMVYKIPISNRFGNVSPTIIPHEILWNIDRVYLKQGRS